jgi:hypothetical protein
VQDGFCRPTFGWAEYEPQLFSALLHMYIMQFTFSKLQEYPVSDHEEDEKGEDVKDLEFRLTHDLNQLQVRRNK